MPILGAFFVWLITFLIVTFFNTVIVALIFVLTWEIDMDVWWAVQFYAWFASLIPATIYYAERDK